MNEVKVLEVIDERIVLGKEFKVYGSWEQPLFLAKDICIWLEMDVSNASKLTKSLDKEEYITTRYNNTSATFLTEDGLYEVLMQSRKPIAKQFKKEVKAILKQMRLTGASFVTGREEEVIENYFGRFSDQTKLLMVKELQTQNDKMKSIINEQSKTVAFVKMISENGNEIDMKKFADCLGIKGLGRNNLYSLLRKMEIILPNKTIPYRKYVEGGYLVVRQGVTKNGNVVFSTKVTPKGQKYLTNKILKEVKEFKANLSEEANLFTKKTVMNVGKSEEEYIAMLIQPQLFLKEWEDVADLAFETYVNTDCEESNSIYEEIMDMLENL